MRYSVITKHIETDADKPFIFENEALDYFNSLVKLYSADDSNDTISLFIVDNLTNTIINSYDFFVSSLPVEFLEVKQCTSTTKDMIDNLHDLMELRGLTLTKISIKTSISVPNLIRFFKAESNPTLRTFCSIKNAILLTE